MDVMIDISKTVLETDRLILRAWKETDVDDFFEYASVDGVGEMAGWKHHESVEESQRILEDFILSKNVFAIVYKDNNKVIGSLGLEKSGANRESKYKDLKLKEIGYVLSKEYWGKGLMPEVVKETIRYCFDKINLDAITISHFIHNNQSQRVIEKCGFQFVKNGTYHSHMGKDFVSKKYILYRK